MHFSKKKTLHSTHSTELFKIFFYLLTLSTAFLQKGSGPGKNTDWDMLNETLDMIDWDNLLDYNGPETAWANFKKVFLIKFMTIFLNLPLRLSTNPHGLIPSATRDSP